MPRSLPRALLLALALCPCLLADDPSIASHVPRVSLGSWWVAGVAWERGGERHSYFLSCHVITVTEERVNFLLSSTDGWAFVCGMDPRSAQLREVLPASFGVDGRRGLYLYVEKGLCAIDANPSLVSFPEYPLVGTLLLGFPSSTSDKGKLLSIHEAETPGEAPRVEEAPLTQTIEGRDGALVATLEAKLGQAAVRLVTEWESGLPWFRSAELEDGVTGIHGHARLLSYGTRTSQFYIYAQGNAWVEWGHARGKVLGGAAAKRVTALEQAYPFESDVVDRVGDELVRLAEAELSPRGPGVRLQPAGDEDIHRGDLLEIDWDLRRFVQVGEGPKTSRWVAVPTSGTMALRVQDLRKVGREELVFVQTRGRDAADCFYRLDGRWERFWEQRCDEDVPAWTLATLQGMRVWAAGPYWSRTGNEGWRWDRVRLLKKLMPRTPPERANARQKDSEKRLRPETWWMLVLRRSDLSLRAAFGTTLDECGWPRPLELRIVAFPEGPTLLTQSMPLLRPKDWLFLPGWPALREDPAPGLTTRLTQKNPGRYETDDARPGTAAQIVVRNSRFFDDLDLFVQKEAARAEKKKRQGNDPALWSVDVTEDELDRLEQGDKKSDLGKLLAKGREGKAHPGEPTIVRVASADGSLVSYFGYDWKYPFWRQAAVVNFKEKYLAWYTLRLQTPSVLNPPDFEPMRGFRIPVTETPPEPPAIPTEGPPLSGDTPEGGGWEPPGRRQPPSREPPTGAVDVPVESGD